MRLLSWALCAIATSAATILSCSSTDPKPASVIVHVTDGGADSGDAAVPACSRTLAVACSGSESHCVRHWPSPLGDFCGANANANSVSVLNGTCAGDTVVLVSTGTDVVSEFFYDANGDLVAWFNWVSTIEQCVGGPADFGYVPSGACNYQPQPNCCENSRAGYAQTLLCKDAGATDATVE